MRHHHPCIWMPQMGVVSEAEQVCALSITFGASLCHICMNKVGLDGKLAADTGAQ